MWAFVLGVVATLGVGVVTDVLTGRLTRVLRRARLVIVRGKDGTYDSQEDDLYMVGQWSISRRLEPSRLRTTLVDLRDRPTQAYVASATLDAAVAARREDSGDLVYLTSFRQDHRESGYSQDCFVTLSASSYAEVRALEQLRVEAPATLSSADAAITSDARSYLSSAVPSSIAMNIVPVTASSEIMCFRRSAAVDSAVGMWTVGIVETMKRADPNSPGRREDFFALAARGLEEELGLRYPDFSCLEITWLGIYLPMLRGHAVAVVRLNLSKSELIERQSTADSSYEHDAIKWLALDRSTIRRFAQATQLVDPQHAGAAILVDGDRWTEHARLALNEAWRYRLVLVSRFRGSTSIS